MKKDELLEMSEKNAGYLFTSEVVEHGISKTYLAKFLKENEFERVAQGIFVAPDVWPDELYILQKTSPKVVFSGETALYLNNLTDREYSKIHVTVPRGYNSSHLRRRGIEVAKEREDIYTLGRTHMESGFGNILTVYDRERSVCEAIISRNKMDIQTFQTVMKEYMRDKSKNLTILIHYAECMNIRDEVMKYVEVMV
jgi:predicted transcriptional regulator of viral defense system